MVANHSGDEVEATERRGAPLALEDGWRGVFEDVMTLGMCLLAGAIFLGLLYFTASSYSQNTSSAAKTDFQIGEPVQFAPYTVAIDEVTTRPRPGAETATLVVVKYTVLNSGSKPLLVSERPDIQLRDQNGVLINRDKGHSISMNLFEFPGKAFSDLNPGLSESDVVVFEVATAQFDQMTWKVAVNGRALVTLSSLEGATGPSSVGPEGARSATDSRDGIGAEEAQVTPRTLSDDPGAGADVIQTPSAAVGETSGAR